MHIDLAQLTREAFLQGGCDTSLIGNLDNHSAIDLRLKSDLCIRINPTDDGLALITSQIAIPLSQIPVHAAVALLEALAKPTPWSCTGALTLLDDDGEQWLTALIRPAILQDSQAYFDSISDFYERILSVKAALFT